MKSNSDTFYDFGSIILPFDHILLDEIFASFLSCSLTTSNRRKRSVKNEGQPILLIINFSKILKNIATWNETQIFFFNIG